MSGRVDSEISGPRPEHDGTDLGADLGADLGVLGGEGAADAGEAEDAEEPVSEARRARWAAAGTGALLTVAGLAAALLRLTGSAPAVVPVAYALGAAVCALAAVLGSRGRTRRALWLLVAGVMVMAVGDQLD